MVRLGRVALNAALAHCLPDFVGAIMPEGDDGPGIPLGVIRDTIRPSGGGGLGDADILAQPAEGQAMEAKEALEFASRHAPYIAHDTAQRK